MRKATRSDKEQVIAVLLESFAQDPHVNWIVGADGNQTARLRTLIDYSFEDAWPSNESYLTDDGAGAAIWKKPGQKEISIHQLWTSVQLMAQLGLTRMRALMAAEQYIEHHRPPEPRWYLWYVGVLPAKRGQGLSHQLLDPMLARIDQAAQLTCLETANPINIAIYERKGFRVYYEYILPNSDGVRIWMMSRQPKQ